MSAKPAYLGEARAFQHGSVGLFRKLGEGCTVAIPFQQSVADYIEAFHSMSSFSREKMTAEAAAAFDDAVWAAVAPFALGGMLSMEVVASVVWGRLC